MAEDEFVKCVHCGNPASGSGPYQCDYCNGTGNVKLTPEQLAKLFHETYERLAPEHTYETRPASAVPWKDVPENNKALMIAVCAVIQSKVLEEVERLEKKAAKVGLQHYILERQQEFYVELVAECVAGQDADPAAYLNYMKEMAEKLGAGNWQPWLEENDEIERLEKGLSNWELENGGRRQRWDVQ